MELNDNRVKSMHFAGPDSIPVSAWPLPAAWMKYREALDEIVAAHPVVFGGHAFGAHDYDEVPQTYAEGAHTDEWGCVWVNVQRGMEAMVKRHPVPTRAAVRNLTPPETETGLPHGFMYLRLSDLRGFEELMIDFAEEPPELRMLIDIVLGHNATEVERLLAGKNSPEMLYFGDDLGMQRSLPISPAKWRKYLKPCFARLYGMCKDAGHSVYMHSDGHIFEIIPDLKDCGVDVINPQVRANGLDNLVDVCKGSICVNLDLDRQMFPFATPSQIDEHVHEAVEKLGAAEGGLWLNAEIGPDVSLENIEAIAVALEEYRGYYR